MGSRTGTWQPCAKLWCLLHTISSPRPSSKAAPPPHLILPHPPLPPVFTVQSHTEQIGTEQLSEAEGTRFHCSANWNLSQPSSRHLLSLHLWPTPHHPSTVFSNIPSAHTACDSAVRERAVGAWLKDEVSSQNWLGRRRAVQIRQWSVAF